MFFEGKPCREPLLASADFVVVIDAQLCCLHQLPLGAIERKPVVCPQRRAKKSNTTKINGVVVEEHDVGSCRCLLQFCASFPEIPAIELVIACHIKNRNRPILEKRNRLGAICDISREHQKVCVHCRGNEPVPRKMLLQEL